MGKIHIAAWCSFEGIIEDGSQTRNSRYLFPYLYRKSDKRTFHISWKFKHPLTESFHSLRFPKKDD
ncbi:phage integrase Arm DNA-binding domain-containing protein [Tatumella sp. JGM118]|uniref:phage integrase Arm DNA-binding domain-containing protein n=1 Tax=Tatumella sp. JGM118 TaxID=2799796 RepID=UPI0035305571